MFFFTEQDSNYRIKGSRDPLGFQSIWQTLGRTVIKSLSTVSSNLIDFQILSYAWYFYGDRDPKQFLNFFLKFEQACGFARGLYLPNDRFNGIDFVRKNLQNTSYSCSLRNEHMLLSNQKGYGIYGKYNRPFNDMRIKEQLNFREVMGGALVEKVPDYSVLETYVDRLMNSKTSTFHKEELQTLSQCLDKITRAERQFYSENILRETGDHVQNELYQLLQNHPLLIETDGFNLYSFIDLVITHDISDNLKRFLIRIRNAEKVLTPYAYLFKTLQSNPTWTADRISEAPIFNSFPTIINYDFNYPIIDSLNQTFTKSPYDMALKTVERNTLISKNRNNSAWLKLEADKIIVCYADGAQHITQFDGNINYEHNYFIPTYISLYRQIMENNG